MRGPALRLVAVVDIGAAHDAGGVGDDFGDGGGGAGEHADELPGGGHGGGAEDGAGDEVGVVGFDLLGQGGGGVRVHGGAVDEEFVGDGFLEGGGDGGADGGVVAEAGEDDGGLGDGGGEGGGDGGFAGGEGGGQVGGALGSAVEDDEGVVEVAFFDEVLAHALWLCWWVEGPPLREGGLGTRLTLPMLPRPIHANWGAIVAVGVVVSETTAVLDQSSQENKRSRTTATTEGAS